MVQKPICQCSKQPPLTWCEMAPATVHCNHTEWVRGHLRGHKGRNKQTATRTLKTGCIKTLQKGRETLVKSGVIGLLMDFLWTPLPKKIPQHKKRNFTTSVLLHAVHEHIDEAYCPQITKWLHRTFCCLIFSNINTHKTQQNTCFSSAFMPECVTLQWLPVLRSLLLFSGWYNRCFLATSLHTTSLLPGWKILNFFVLQITSLNQ